MSTDKGANGRDTHAGNGVDVTAEQAAGDDAVDLCVDESELQAGGGDVDVELIAEPELPELTADERRIAELETELADAQHKLRQYSEAVDRVRLEFTRSKERIEREHARTLDDHKVKAVAGLLEVVDSLAQALNDAGDGGQAFVDGVRIVRGEFEKALADLGLSRFDPTGEDFDPNRHDALTMVPVADKAHDGKVVQVLHMGATVHDKVLRPASVVVGKFVG